LQDSVFLLLLSSSTGQKFRDKLEGHFSKWEKTREHFPQAFLLVPLLYIAYVTDTHRRPGREISQLQDETVKYTVNENITQLGMCRYTGPNFKCVYGNRKQRSKKTKA
jgi:hypothetical protein